MAVKPFDVMNLGRAVVINPEQVGYRDSIDIIKDESLKVQKSFVKIGWYLKHIRDNELYKENGYASVWECAADQLGYSQSTVSRFINICEKFSKDHNSPELDVKYAGFDKSQMIEMLPMEPDQLDKVTPEMTVKQIRDIKIEGTNISSGKVRVPKADDGIPGQTSIESDFPEYLPEDRAAEQGQEIEETESYATSHKGNAHCPPPGDKEVKMRPEVKGLMDDPYCAESDTAQITILTDKDEIPGQTSIESDFPEYLPEKRPTEQKISPYGLPETVYPEGSLLTTVGCGHKYDCFSCAQDCMIRQEGRYCVEAPMGNPFGCTTMSVLENIRAELGEQCQFINPGLAEHTAGSNEPVPCCKNCDNESCNFRCMRSTVFKEKEQPENPDPLSEDSIAVTRYILEQEKKKLDDILKVDEVEKLPEMMVLRQKTIVGALAAMVCDLESADTVPEEPEQPELPVLKNNDQRKNWLADYKAWGLWYRDENIDVNYYKYDFPDGSRLVAAEYPQRYEYWDNKRRDEHYYHLIEKNKKGYKKTYDEQYRNQTDAETYLVEFLKNLQKKEQGKI